MAIDNGRRIVDQEVSLTIAPDDSIIIDSVANGTRQITYSALCEAVAVTLGISTIKATADAAMVRKTYDANGNGIVDNAEALEGHKSSYFATAQSVKDTNSEVAKKMTTATYDADGDGVVDNAAKVNNHTVHSDVPAQAQFTDTIYDDTQVKKDIKNNTDEIAKLQKGIGLSVVNGKVQQTVKVG